MPATTWFAFSGGRFDIPTELFCFGLSGGPLVLVVALGTEGNDTMKSPTDACVPYLDHLSGGRDEGEFVVSLGASQKVAFAS